MRTSNNMRRYSAALLDRKEKELKAWVETAVSNRRFEKQKNRQKEKNA